MFTQGIASYLLQAAVATSVSLRSYLLVQTSPVAAGTCAQVSLKFPDIGLNHSWLLTELPSLADTERKAPTGLDSDIIKAIDPVVERSVKKEFQHAAVSAFLYLYVSLARPSPHQNISFLLKSTIPIGSGLGSSASISVCLAAALLLLAKYIPTPTSSNAEVLKKINDWAYLGEKCIHGNPSGVDNTVATFGGGVIFRKERRERRLSNGTFTPSLPAEKYIINIPTLQFLLTDTNHPRRTALLVAHVADLLTNLPGVTPHILTAIDGIAAEARRLLESNENITERLGELISINQGLLNSVGVGHEKLDTVARLTKEIGWTKLTGAGGGGCALTLLKEGTFVPCEM